MKYIKLKYYAQLNRRDNTSMLTLTKEQYLHLFLYLTNKGIDAQQSRLMLLWYQH